MPSAGSLRSIPRAVGRFSEVEDTVAALQRRVDDLESALDALRDEMRRTTQELLEELARERAARGDA
jgi:cell division protein FtsB